MQFILTIKDFTDPDAINRRQASRDAHLAGIEKLVRAGNFKSGGAILDHTGKMIGSSAHVEFDSREQLDAWINHDPYVTGKVWDKIEINESVMFPVEKFK